MSKLVYCPAQMVARNRMTVPANGHRELMAYQGKLHDMVTSNADSVPCGLCGQPSQPGKPGRQDLEKMRWVSTLGATLCQPCQQFQVISQNINFQSSKVSYAMNDPKLLALSGRLAQEYLLPLMVWINLNNIQILLCIKFETLFKATASPSNGG